MPAGIPNAQLGEPVDFIEPYGRKQQPGATRSARLLRLSNEGYFGVAALSLDMLSLDMLSLDMLSLDILSFEALCFLAFFAFFFAFFSSALVDLDASDFMLSLASVFAGSLAAGAGAGAGAGGGVWAAAVIDTAKALASSADISLFIFPVLSLVKSKDDTSIVSGALTSPTSPGLTNCSRARKSSEYLTLEGRVWGDHQPVSIA